MPLAEAGKRLRLAVGSYSGVITFVDADSTAALEVTPMYSPGTDPETESATLVTHLYAVTGKISWDGGTESGSVEIAAPECLVLDGQPVGSPPVVRELPKWIAEEMVGLLDRRASATIEPSLEVDRPTGLGLLELGDHRQKEVRWLAARCLAHIGRFEPLVAAIDNQEMKQEWENYIEKLREAVRRDGPSAAGVRRTMEQQFGEAAADAYRMLWGYTPVDMIKGQDAKLVELLEHETLALRVLSFWSLKEITGLGLFYKPDQTAAKRQQSVQRWKQKLQAGQIRFKLPEGTQESREKVTPAKPPSPAGSG